MVTTTSGRIKIFLALAVRPTKNLVKDSFFLRRVGVVKQSQSKFFELSDRIIHVIRVMFNSDAATLTELVDVFVTVVNQKSLPVKGDLSKLKYVPSLSEIAKRMLRNLETVSRKIEGVQETRGTPRRGPRTKA